MLRQWRGKMFAFTSTSTDYWGLSIKPSVYLGCGKNRTCDLLVCTPLWQVSSKAFNVHHSSLLNKTCDVPHAPAYLSLFLFEQQMCIKKEKNATRCLMFNLLFCFGFFSWKCSEWKQSFLLYKEFRWCYYRTVNLHAEKIRLGRMRYKESFSLRYVKDTIRILSVLHGSTRVRTLSKARSFFTVKLKDIQRKMRNIF